MKRNVALAFALLVVHLVALLDHDAVHLDGTTRLRCHHDLIRHHLTEEGEQCRSVLLRAETVLTAHEESAELAR